MPKAHDIRCPGTGHGPTSAADYLTEERLVVDHNTRRRWLKEAGLWTCRRARSPFRQRRERKMHFGEQVQPDGSHHGWFEDRGECCCLINLFGDATGTTLSYLSKEETTEAAMQVLCCNSTKPDEDTSFL